MTEAGDVVDPDKEDADPDVPALALRLLEQGHDVYVVTEDHVDRNRITVTTPCDRFDIPHCSVRDVPGGLGDQVEEAFGRRRRVAGAVHAPPT